MVGRLSIEEVAPARWVRADLQVPGDKSIAHRALLLAAIASGRSRITGIPAGEDVAATVSCLEQLGIALDRAGDQVTVTGRPVGDWPSPAEPLDCRNSGTTMRLLAGLLAGSRVRATLTGDASLSSRPMERIAMPLRAMGATVETTAGRAPLRLQGGPLQGITHQVSPPSAQVKSAVLLAGLHADGRTCVLESASTRDHSERLLHAMGARLDRGPGSACIERTALSPIELAIPGDLSSAAFFLAAASLRKGWSATIGEVGLNPTRTAFLDVLHDMGAEVSVERVSDGIEPGGTVRVVGGTLHALRLGAEQVAMAIDEIPILIVLATQARGTSVIDGIGELRAKESDRIHAMVQGLSAMGAGLRVRGERIVIDGETPLHGAEVDAAGDHRIAMALAVAALRADSPTRIRGADRVDVSYPGFFAALERATVA